MIKTNDIHMRDPFIVPVMEDKIYYLFGTTDKNCLKGPGVGFNCFKSRNLSDWEGPFKTFSPPENFWGKENLWAPEVHYFNSLYYMFASFKAETIRRATHILVSDNIIGPYIPLTESPQTPAEWECLDGTLFIDCVITLPDRLCDVLSRLPLMKITEISELTPRNWLAARKKQAA